ncbi:MAG: DsbA family protein, partial [Pseudomonadota bacterium]
GNARQEPPAKIGPQPKDDDARQENKPGGPGNEAPGHEGHNHGVFGEGEDLDLTEFNGQQAEEIRSIVYDFLLTHPEILFEALEVFQDRQELAQRENARDSLTAFLDDRNGFTTALNRAKARVAVVELFDYHCGHCKRASGFVRELAQRDEDIVVAFREYPILKKESRFAALAALAAREQDKYLDFHFALMNANGTLTQERVFEIAKQANLDVRKLKATIKQTDGGRALTETATLAQGFGAGGTPAFIIASLDGGFVDIVEGFNPDRLRESIAEAKAVASDQGQ